MQFVQSFRSGGRGFVSGLGVRFSAERPRQAIWVEASPKKSGVRMDMLLLCGMQGPAF